MLEILELFDVCEAPKVHEEFVEEHIVLLQEAVVKKMNKTNTKFFIFYYLKNPLIIFCTL